MEKINYFLAAVYQGIKKRRPEGTPYFNICFGITGILLLNLFGVFVAFRTLFHIDLLTESKNVLITCSLIFASIVFFVVRMIIPFEKIDSIEVDIKDIKRNRVFFLLYCFLSLFIVLILLFPSVRHR